MHHQKKHTVQWNFVPELLIHGIPQQLEGNSSFAPLTHTPKFNYLYKHVYSNSPFFSAAHTALNDISTINPRRNDPMAEKFAAPHTWHTRIKRTDSAGPKVTYFNPL